MTSIDGRYASLTTYRRDGSGVPTAVWFVADGTALYVWTGSGTGKVKRIRNNGEVTIAPSGRLGRPRGEAVPARAELCDAEGTRQVRELIKAKYGWIGRLLVNRSLRRGGPDGTTGLRITFLDGPSSHPAV